MMYANNNEDIIIIIIIIQQKKHTRTTHSDLFFRELREELREELRALFVFYLGVKSLRMSVAMAWDTAALSMPPDTGSIAGALRSHSPRWNAT